nr:hypothetical protein GTC16762_26450 [Pigmentibacter ruber]
MTRQEIITSLEKVGLVPKGKEIGPWIDFCKKSLLDSGIKRPPVKAKIHPPDQSKTTNFHHLHIYDARGNSLNKDLIKVKYDTLEAHIPIKQP